MSLDRQRILSELGSVMNQLKSADCGCMGKLFSNQNQGEAMGAPLPTCGGCRRGCCHGHGYGHSAPYAGEPYSMGNNMNHGMNRPCMGHCNPPKLYADTYSYLNNNLMQPVVKEVYNDLKSISPENTIMNNPLGNQMGLQQASPGLMSSGNAGNMSNPMHNAPEMSMGNAGAPMGQSPGVNPMGGMGPQIMNMIMGDSGMKPSNVQGTPGNGGQSAGPMGNNSLQSAPDHAGAMNNMTMPTGANQGQYTSMGNANQPSNMHGFANPATQFVSKENMYSIPQGNPTNQGVAQPGTTQMGNMHNAMVSGNAFGGTQNVQQISAANQQFGQNASSMMPNMNPGGQQMSAANKPQYGQHTQGVMKFNEMFPGVMQGGDLGFDPMAIAIQMNPANQQKAAMDTMQRLMNGGPASRMADMAGNASVMKPVMDATKTAVESISNPAAAQGQQNLQMGNQQLTGQQQVPAQQNVPPTQAINQQMLAQGQEVANTNSGAVLPPNSGATQQQVYTAASGQPMFNQQYQQQQQQPQQQPIASSQQYAQQNQLYADPAAGTTFTPGQENLNSQAQPSQGGPQSNDIIPQQMIREPIFPADISRTRPFTYPKQHQKYYNYNTLGQPVEMLPAKMFHPPEPSLPQTLSPQPPTTKLRNDYLKYSNVKSTVSKTSLAGNKPVGRTPSRSQLQHIYNQYKGSHSYTQQNVRAPVQGGTFSEGKLNVPPVSQNPPQQVPVERVGGDTAANNQIVNNQMSNKVEQVIGQIGDVPAANKPQGDGAPMKAPGSPTPARHAKLRNGLQDVVYTSYPSSAAWSFHGTNTYRPVSVGYHFRNFK